MTPLNRLVDPSKADRGPVTKPKVHYEAPGGAKSLCSQATVYRTIDGERMRVWHRTKRAVTCKPCVKRLIVEARAQLEGLTGDQVEDILAHIDTFRNKYLEPKGGNGAAVSRTR
jgi:hypothetical protein